MKKTFISLSALFLAFVLAFSCCAAIFAFAEGESLLAEDAIFVFDIKEVNGVIEGEDCVICTTQEAYDACNPNWAVTLLLQEQEDGTLLVIRPPHTSYGSLPEVNVGNGIVALVVHSAAWDLSMKDEFPNIEAKLAAESAAIGMYVVLDGIDLETATGSGTAALYRGQAIDPELPKDAANVALGASYVTSDLFRQGGPETDWGWDENAPIAYPDTDGVELTDGRFPATETTYYDEAFFAFAAGSPDYEARGYAYIRVDLGQAYELSRLVLYVGTSYLNGGIYAPSTVSFYAVGDMDGSDPDLLGDVYPEDDPFEPCVPCILPTQATAQFIEIRIFAANWMFVTEFEAYDRGTADPDDPVCRHRSTYSDHKEPTCTENGYEKKICDNCGETVFLQVFPATGHDYEAYFTWDHRSGELIVTADLVCRNDESHIVSDVPGTAEIISERPATCEEESETVYRGTVVYEGATYMSETSSGERALGHAYENGVCTRCGAKEPAYSISLGDLDGNGKINATDYLMLKRYVLGSFTLDEAQTLAADVNRDGKVTAVDYMLVKRHVLGTYVIG